MYSEVFVRSLIEKTDHLARDHVLFLEVKKKNLIIPINLASGSAQALVEALTQHNLPRPTVYDSFRRTLIALNAQLLCVIISHAINGVYYTFLRVAIKGEKRDVDIKLTDGLAMGIITGAPILIENTLARVKGIESDKQLEMELGIY